jgi:hypothetical protein
MQDPPEYIEWEFSRDSTIDTNILGSYTRAGNKVDFVVWPVHTSCDHTIGNSSLRRRQILE